MDINDLLKASKVSEGPKIEYKLSSRKLSKDIWETVSAFANTEFSNDKLNDRFILKLAQPFWTDYVTDQVTPQVTPQVTDQVSLKVEKQIEKMDRIIAVLKFCEVPRSLAEILKFFNLKDRKYLLQSIVKPLVEEGMLKRTIPDKPTSRFQKYTAVKSK